MPNAPTTPHDKLAPDASMKETVTQVVIAFVVAFVFRGFVVEPFLIPTGSMAPTLMGAHMRIGSPESGYSWPVGPWQYSDYANQVAKPIQGGPGDNPIRVSDPMTQQSIDRVNVPRRAGDRIFVLKSIYSIFDPKRFDVVVFKCPFSPQENYIKRLIGLPGEQIALVDGDVFTRSVKAVPATEVNSPDAWSQPGWTIARKPERVQRSVWQLVFDSQYTPLNALNGTTRFTPPWVGEKSAVAPANAGSNSGWTTESTLVYKYAGTEPTTLSWDSQRWPIRDSYPYNQTERNAQSLFYPVADVRVRFAIKPSAENQQVSVRLVARRHEFEAQIIGTAAKLRMRPLNTDGIIADSKPVDDKGWVTIGSGSLAALPVGEFTTIDFWHADQTMQLWIGDSKVCAGVYDWSPALRFELATGHTVASLADASSPANTGQFADPSLIMQPRLSIAFNAGPVELTRVAVWRDLHYQPKGSNQQMAFGADPRRMPTLTDDQFFMCGDNSPASLDARLWTSVDRWVAEQVDPTIGVVNRELLVGKAFFVYFPAPVPGKRAWMPDAGRLRFIW